MNALIDFIEIPADLPKADFQTNYPDDAACWRKCMEAKFGTDIRCSTCEKGALVPSKNKELWTCSHCDREEKATKDTIFQGNVKSMQMFRAMHAYAAAKGKISGRQLANDVDLTESVARKFLKTLKRVSVFRGKVCRVNILTKLANVEIRTLVGDDPWMAFDIWLEKAYASGLPNSNAMALCTSNSNGEPSSRIVLLKKWSKEEGFLFFTNYNSRKSLEMKANPHAALLFFWDELGAQIRIEGRVEQCGYEQNKRYFDTRPRMSRIGAWGSVQSQPLASRSEFTDRIANFNKLYKGEDIPLPNFWGGWKVVPKKIEFWRSVENRLHERIVFHVKSGQVESSELLYP